MTEGVSFTVFSDGDCWFDPHFPLDFFSKVAFEIILNRLLALCEY